MELTNEIKLKIFSNYIGCRVKYIGTDGEYKEGMSDTNKDDYNYRFILTGIKKDNHWCTTALFGDILNREDLVVDTNIETDINDCKLILTPLSEITDEDAIELTNILGWKGLNSGEAKALFGLFFLIKSNDNLKSQLLYDLNDICMVYDYLRFKGYMVPYMGIDLYEAGIAIKPIKYGK